MSRRRLARARTDDLPAVEELERLCFSEPWKRPTLGLFLGEVGSLLLLARDGVGDPVGYALFRRTADEAELLRIAVLPAWRRRGVAAELVTTGLGELSEEGCERCFLEVRAGNRPARRLYERIGFVPVGCRSRYYRDGEDALLYTLRLVA